KDIPHTGAAAILVSKEYENLVPKDTKALITQSPHLSFAFLSKLFAKPLISTAKEKSTKISQKSARIMPNVYIGDNVNIGENVIIMAGAYIGDNVSIGDESIIHPNVVIYNDTK
ncbi:UDP-3-O-(3-hydroxymyristoyl)glucosamine N-acyltransferase, partial [Campylobacter jejuni]|nr:UDP-3-O-(3-hydroxymyristoyl)glucosamine N-acyltransferase [Campylobacter jejuni]